MSDDLISRQAAIDALYRVDEYNGQSIKAIRNLPSAQERKGKWIKQNPLVDTEECSLCKYNIISEELETPFCPWCGAEMEERRDDDI